MIGKTVSHYRITRQLGAGGMGVVYEAVDTNLDRSVALKFLPPELTGNTQAKARFVHEAKAASALDHVNVCTIYEIDETDDGQMFLAMACYQGETVKDRIARGPLPLDEAMDITQQVADGLAMAHAQDIVHRDIKPANLFLTGQGLVKILDFGLAKLEGQTKITRTGTTLGTASYMSPEQARGEETDQRSDLWCLGVVLYEMVTGRVPFQGENAQAVINGITTAEPDPVTALRTGIPLDLERMITKCLAKDPRERYQHADDLLADLRHLQRLSSEGTTQILATGISRSGPARRWPWILGLLGALAIAAVLAVQLRQTPAPNDEAGLLLLAVLPFENLGDPADAYFADGIADEILTKLTSFPELGVIAKESAFRYRGNLHTIPEIGEQLGVDYVLKGTIRWQRLPDGQSRVRITPRLVSVDGNRNIWAEAYEENLDQIFAVQADIGQKVIEALDITLLSDRRDAIWKKGTNDLQAYSYFLRAKELNTNLLLQRDHLFEAEALLDNAVERDPEFAVAYAWLSMVHSRIFHWAYDRSLERVEKARTTLETATRLEPELPEVFIAAGAFAYWTARDYDASLVSLEKATQLRPNDSYLHLLIGANKKRQGRFEEALVHYDQATILNPTYAGAMIEIGICQGLLRRFDEAEATYRRVLAMWPDHPSARGYLAEISLRRDGNGQKARAILEEEPVPDLRTIAMSNAWYRVRRFSGDYEEALAKPGGPDGEYYRLLTGSRKAELYQYLGRPAERNAAATDALGGLEEKVRSEPDEYLWHRELGLVYAFLGRKEDAIREGQEALALMPPERGAIDSAHSMEALATIYVLVGEEDLALDQIEQLLAAPTHMTRPIFRGDPAWGPLRDHPRFRELVR